MFPGLTDDRLFINIWAWLLIAIGVIVVVYSCLIGNVPYGRYATENWGFGLDAKLAWILQELPAFIIPFFLLVRKLRNSQFSLFSPNVVLTVLFLMHYFRRYVLAGSKKIQV